MEIIDQQTGILIANLSSSQPSFVVSGLDSERLLQISVMAVNSKGVSDPVLLEVLTLKAPEKRLGKNFENFFFIIYYLSIRTSNDGSFIWNNRTIF